MTMKNYKLGKWLDEKQVEETQLLADETVKLLTYFKRDLKTLAGSASYRDFSNLCSNLRESSFELAKKAIAANAKIRFIADNFSELSEPATENDIEDMIKEGIELPGMHVINVSVSDDDDKDEVKKKLFEAIEKEINAMKEKKEKKD